MDELSGACQSKKLQDKQEAEKPSLSYADFHHEITKNVKLRQKFAGDPRKQPIAGKEVDEDELVKYMSKLPSYLQRGEALKEKALNFGVLDWGKLEKWQYKHSKPIPCKSSRCSPSSSETSSSFSTDRSSAHSSVSPTRQRARRPSLHSHMRTTQMEDSHRAVEFSSARVENFQESESTQIQRDVLNRPENFVAAPPLPSKKQVSERKREIDPRSGALQNGLNIGISSNTGLNIEEEKIQKLKLENTRVSDSNEISKKIVLLLPKDLPESNSSSDISRSCQLPSRFRSEASSQANQSSRDLGTAIINRAAHSSIPVSQPPNVGSNSNPYEKRISEEKPAFLPVRSTSGDQSKAQDPKPSKVKAEKVRSISPFYRFINGTSKMSHSDEHNVAGRARSSPLRRLLDPLLKPKAEIIHRFVEPLERASKSTDVSVVTKSTKVKLGITGCKKISVTEFSMEKQHGRSTTQALLRVADKSGTPLYTFAVNNESNILAATAKKLNTDKTKGFNCIYTYFTIQDTKNKKKGHDYISNVIAQMKVSSSEFSHLREFVLFSVEPRQKEDETSEFRPNNELAAILVKSFEKTNPSIPSHSSSVTNEESVTTTVILPSAVHSLPSKGGPSSLIERWINGGSCDCGGWDIGCKLQILTNPDQVYKKSSSSKACPTADRLELFHQDGVQRVFSLTPFKDGAYSVEFHASLSVIQAFSICTAVLDSIKQSQFFESSNSVEETHGRSRTEAEVPSYVSNPPHSPAGRV